MVKVFRVCALQLGALFMGLTLWGNSVAAQSPDRLQPKPSLVENIGQLNQPEVRYFTKSPNLEVGFAEGRVLFNALRWGKGAGAVAEHRGGVLFTLRVGDGSARPQALQPLPGRSHYLLGARDNDWLNGARHFQRVIYRDAYPGIDMVYFFDDHAQLTYEFIVRPGADPARIKLEYTAIDALHQPTAGNMDILTAVGRLQDGTLHCYQDIDGQRQVVASRFRKLAANAYGIELLAPYDRSRPLVIDPTLVFSSYWGAGGTNNRSALIDAQGNLYMSGGTSSTTWPTTPGAYQRTHRGNGWPDVTAAKFDPDGNLIWSTLLGGPSEDYAYVSAVNQAGELYLAGRAGDGFPTTAGAFDRTFNGGKGSGGSIHAPTDAFVARLSADGARLVYSTYIGGSGDENGRAIHLLPSGELLVGGGNTTSTNLPVTPGVFKSKRGGARDSWVAKVAADGSHLKFLTYFGPNNDTKPDETIRGLGTDASGNIWLGGTTTGNDLSASADAFQKNHGGGSSEAYIAKLSADGKNLLYFSWLGGNGFDELETESVSDAAGNFYVAGSTRSTNFPATSGAFQRTLKGTADAWVARINNNGSLRFATLFGGTSQGNDGFFGPVVDDRGNVYATGRFASADCPVTPDAFQSQKAAPNDTTQDAFLAVFTPDGKDLLYATYFGGNETEHGRHLAIDSNGTAVVIIGETNSTNLPLVNAPQTQPAGAFVAKFDIADLRSAARPAPSLPMPAPAGQQVIAYSAASNPLLSADPEAAEPIGAGNAANGGETFSLRVGMNEMSSAVDLYIALFFPALDPNSLYGITSNNAIRMISKSLIPWRSNTTVPINENPLGDISLTGFPSGAYYVALMATPKGRLDQYYLWATFFNIP